MKTALLLIVALMLSSILCAASCVQACGEPSCHHEKNSKSVCSHELILDRSAAPLQPAEIAASTTNPQFIAIEFHERATWFAPQIDLEISPPLRR